MYSHAVMSVIKVFPSFVMLSLACVFVEDGLPSVEMWFDRGEDWCCGLSKVGMVEMVGFRQVMWFVMLESAKDRILGVDTPGQHVPPCVQCGMSCLLVRDAVGSVPYPDEWEIGVITRPGSHSARGVMVPWLPWETLAMLWYCVLPYQSLEYIL
jgi:hypothetical protein